MKYLKKEEIMKYLKKEEINKILEFCMNSDRIRLQYPFIDKDRKFKKVRDFLEILVIHGFSFDEIKKMVRDNYKVLRKEKLYKIAGISQQKQE